MTLSRKQIHFYIHFVFIVAIAFCLPMGRYVPNITTFLVANWLLELGFIEKLKKFIQQPMAWLLMLVYVTVLIGLTYAKDKISGEFDAQVKLTMLVFPFVLSTIPQFNKKQVQALFISFLFGCFIASLLCLVRSLGIYQWSGENYFFYYKFSFLMHPSYFAMYLCFAVAIILYVLIEYPIYLYRSVKIGFFFLLFFFLVMIVLLSSKAGLLVLVLLLFVSILHLIFQRQHYRLGIISLLFIIVAALSIPKTAPPTYQRIKTALYEIDNEKNLKSGGVAFRMQIWGIVKEAVKDDLWIGVGTGDEANALVEKYKELNLKKATSQRLNAHNQFLQVLLALGLMGLIPFLASLLIPFIISIKRKQHLYFLFLSIIIINFLTEAMLERQAGVMFYAFFNAVFLFLIPFNRSGSIKKH